MKHLLLITTMFIATAGLAYGGLNLGIMNDLNKRIIQLDAKVTRHALKTAAPAPAPSPAPVPVPVPVPVPASAPAITSPGTASGTAGRAFTFTISASNTPTSYAAAGLPAGLSVNAQSGLISGTPSASGTASVTLSASNSGGTGTKTLTLTIAAVPAPAGIKTGAYTENNTTIETATLGFENWLNSGSVYALQYGGDASASDFTGSVPWALGLVPNNRKLLWSQPLVYVGASLASAASGSLDSAYASIATSLAAGYAQGKILLVRIGWEFNGGWYAWTTNGGQSANYAAAWRRLALAIRAKQPNIKFEWCPNWGQTDPTAAYPGDDVVDYIGMDAYEESQYVSGSASARWAGFLNHSGWDLTKMAAFAAAHNKKMGISEYASDYNDGYFVTHMAEWIKSHNVDHHSYWNSTHPINTLLANYPVNQTAFYSAWGGQ